jgi:hypothetical protein
MIALNFIRLLKCLNMKKNYVLFLFAITAGLLFFSCSYSAIEVPEIEIPDDVSFSEQVESIFETQGCTSCHNESKAPNLTLGYAYSSLTSSDKYINLENPEASLIYIEPSPEGGHFKKYTYAQSALVLAWITNGAQDN